MNCIFKGVQGKKAYSTSRDQQGCHLNIIKQNSSVKVLACVTNGRYGYIDTTGQEVINLNMNVQMTSSRKTLPK